jgi:hypothetical protein
MSSAVPAFTRIGSNYIPVYDSIEESNFNCKTSDKPVIPIISIDGGGVRGIMPLTYLAEFEFRTKLPISRLGKIFAGASIGGMLVTALNLPNPNDRNKPKFTAEQLRDQFPDLAQKIFTKNISQRIPGHDLTFPKYSAENLMEVIDSYAGEEDFRTTFNEVIVPSWEKSTRNAVLFRTSQACDGKVFEHWKAKDVMNAAVRAPTYFDPYNPLLFNPSIPSNQGFCFCDGGLIANNPSLLAYNIADEIYGCNQNLFMVSLGTGIQTIDPETCNHSHWGEVTWGWDLNLLNDVFDGVSDMYDAMTSSRFSSSGAPNNYIRIQPVIEGSALDNVSAIKGLRTLVEEDIETKSALIQKISEILETAAYNEPKYSPLETY